MGFPTLSCKIGFASNPFDASQTFTEVGPASGAGPGGKGWLRSFTTKRGRERLLRSQAQFQAGTLTANLDNRDRRFDPTNSAGPYWPNVQPEKVIQIGATWSSTYYPIWTGYVDDWPQNWPGFQEGVVPLVATDLFKSLSIKRPDATSYSAQVLADGATAYFRFQEPAGATVALDSSGNGLTAPVSGKATFGVLGALPWAGSTGLTLAPAAGAVPMATVQMPDCGVGASPPGITVEIWINTTSTTGWAFMQYPASGVGLPIMQVLSGSGTVAVDFIGGGNLIGSAVVNDGTWHHIVAAYGVGSGGGQLYVDGVLDVSNATTPSSAHTLPVTGQLVAIAGTGSVAEFAVYPTQFNSTQVATHFSKGGWGPGYTGQLFSSILDNVQVPSSIRSIDTGRTYCQADLQNETQTKVLSLLQKLEQTEQGQCYVNAAGNIVFEDRYHRFQSPNANSVATFGDGGSAHPSEVPYAMGGVTLNFDRAELFNDVPVTRRNGVQQEAVNSASVGEFTNRTMPGLSDLMMATDVDALYCSEWILADTAYPQLRVGNLILDPTLNDALWPLVLGLEIGNVVTVVKHNIPGGGSAVNLACRVEGIEHQVDPPRSWKTTIHLSLVDTQPWFILNDPVMGLLDQGNRWGW